MRKKGCSLLLSLILVYAFLTSPKARADWNDPTNLVIGGAVVVGACTLALAAKALAKPYLPLLWHRGAYESFLDANWAMLRPPAGRLFRELPHETAAIITMINGCHDPARLKFFLEWHAKIFAATGPQFKPQDWFRSVRFEAAIKTAEYLESQGWRFYSRRKPYPEPDQNLVFKSNVDERIVEIRL